MVVHHEVITKDGRETNRSKFVKDVHASRSESESSQASLRRPGMVNLPEMMKPATYTEEMTECTCKVPRGRMEWRV